MKDLRMVRALRVPGVLVSLVLAMVFPAWGGSNYILYVSPPSGGDDTAVLQAALDNCMTNYPSGCAIQLTAGTYESQQLIAENFHGTVQGMGMDVTTVELLAPLVVTVSNQNVQDIPPSRTNKYPVLLLFTGGDITVSDMTFKVSAYNPTTPWCYGGAGCGQTWLEAPVGAIGSSVNLTVERVGFEGGPGQIDGFTNYNNGVLFWGVFSPAQPLAGTFRVVSSRFRNSGNSWEVFFVRDAQIIIGGSPSDGNVFENDELGGAILDADHSVFEYSHNNVTLAANLYYAGLWVLQGVDSIPAEPTQFLIQHNTFLATGNYVDGIFVVDYGPRKGAGKKADIVVTDNTIQLGGSATNPAWAGVEAGFTVDAVISNNRISGADAVLGISAEASSGCTLKGNDLQQLQPLWARVGLLGTNSGFRWNTNNCTVVGGNNKVDVYDEGTNDILVGVNNMQGNPPSDAIKAAMQNRQAVIESMRVR